MPSALDPAAQIWRDSLVISSPISLNSVGQNVPLNINMGFAKVWRTIFFLQRCLFPRERI